MSQFNIGNIRATHLQVGDNNRMVVHTSVTRLADAVARSRAALRDAPSVERAVTALDAELSAPQPRTDRISDLIRTIDAGAAGAPAVVQSLDAVRQMLGVR